jgi:hypothetical protein
LLVDAALTKAIKTESAMALGYWFGVSSASVTRWWKAFGVDGQVATPGSRTLHQERCRKAQAALRTRVIPEAERAARLAAMKRSGRRPGPRWTPENGAWTPE